jgi:hypothetical protein
MKTSYKLRHNPTVEVWIQEYQKDGWHQYPDCQSCGFPHNSTILCGRGATFGSVWLGAEQYSIDASNVNYMLQFVQSLGPGFHWKNEVFFDVQSSKVIVRHIDKYNDTPDVKVWEIPLEQWDSIKDFVQRKRDENI